MTRTVNRTSDVLGTIAEQREAIADAFNTLPLAAENIARAYNPDTRDLRVRLDVRRMAPYGQVARESFCNAFVPQNSGVCKALVEDNATFFDGFVDLFAQIPGRSDAVMSAQSYARRAVTVTVLAAAFTLGACGGPDLYDVPMPSKVNGETYTLNADFASALNLPHRFSGQARGKDSRPGHRGHDVELRRPRGIRGHEECTKIPTGSRAEVRLTAPVGEAFVALIPPDEPAIRSTC